MPRLFVAIDLLDDIKSQLVSLKTGIPTARWTQVENMHLTLRFIGDVPDSQVDKLKAKLAAIESSPFDMQIQGVGRFPPQQKKAARVLWAGIRKQQHLLDLQSEVERAVVSMGIDPENRPYSPHLTLARLKADKPLRQVDNFLSKYNRLRSEPFRIESFILMRSDLTSRGAIYTHEAVFDLKD